MIVMDEMFSPTLIGRRGNDRAFEIRLVVEQIGAGDQPAHAVAEDEDGFPRLPAFDHLVIGRQRVGVI